MPVLPLLRRRATSSAVHGAIALLFLIGLVPFIFVLLSSLKTTDQLYDSYWAFPWPMHLENYGKAWAQIEPYIVTTVIVAAASAIGTILLSTGVAFVLARYRFLGRRLIFVLISCLLMVPSVATLIPLFVMMRDLHLLNTRWAIIIPHVCASTALAVVLIKSFIEDMPRELFEAATVDGANGWRLFFHITVPLSLPVLGTVTLLTVINVWNDFFWPLLTITENSLRTISVGLSFFSGQNSTDYGPLFAGYILASLPLLLLFVFLSKYFLAGMQGGLSGVSK
ncbi:MAG: carbohydrate ABC transporter permease [Microbacterium sp.]|uniref:carbohydrate ABC transporter permease n=1 Tax=Microbacterium sp. TaxID=51671 RepID=UPI0039E2DEDB